MHYCVEKQVFSWCTKNSHIWCINTLKSRFSRDATKNKVYIWCIIMFRSSFSHDAPKALIFNALLWGKADFLVTRQKGANLLHYYVEKQVFSWRAEHSYIWSINSWKSSFSRDVTENKRYIWCIITFCSRFSHDAPITLIFDALLRGKAGFLMTRQKGANLLQYYVSKQVFSWRNRKHALIRGKTGFLLTRPKTKCIFDALLRFVAGFLMTH